MNKNEVIFLSQLIRSLEDAEQKIELAHQHGDSETFGKLKKFMFQLIEKIDEVVK